MNRLPILLLLALCTSQSSSFAQQTDTASLSRRQNIVRKKAANATIRRYEAGTYTIGGRIGGTYFTSPEARIFIIGLNAGIGYFPINRLQVSAELGMANDFRRPEPDPNMQSLSLQALYFSSDKKLYSLFGGLRFTTLRYNYEPVAGLQFYNDAIDGKRYTHYVPSLAFPVGVSIKASRHLSVQLGCGYNLSLANTAHRVPQYNPLYVHTFLSYHFKK